ncbi:MAG: hypothetical protein ACOC1K_01570 [Nanoarchaeota archaeon]
MLQRVYLKKVIDLIKKSYIATEKYGCFTGFYDNGKFMHNYALEIKDVIAWQKLPKAPLLKK